MEIPKKDRRTVMKIKTKQLSYEEVMALPRNQHRKPMRPWFLLQLVVRILAVLDLFPTKFTYKTHGMEKIGKHEPCLILMNHSSFIDLKIAATVLYPRRYNIICTTDGFVGKRWLMRLKKSLKSTRHTKTQFPNGSKRKSTPQGVLF